MMRWPWQKCPHDKTKVKKIDQGVNKIVYTICKGCGEELSAIVVYRKMGIK